eukprot:CAMPEP_0198111172 /NCGR_PEP_ID=MMETSP1442-20131203/3145_1 /TAXON_ID= /ORGANISM="Craspedostauros australis, Strain CCMP3328" /LENGTH=56 /DNA_ID=CAMNT_0043767513 /DNA_START=391 /DNA_END=558 /DNA_ORIENTATION=+
MSAGVMEYWQAEVGVILIPPSSSSEAWVARWPKLLGTRSSNPSHTIQVRYSMKHTT